MARASSWSSSPQACIWPASASAHSDGNSCSLAASAPDGARCLASCGAAAASGVVLPFRLDYLVKIFTLRRLGGVRLGLKTIGVSIVALGMVDAVAMLPLAAYALAVSGRSPARRWSSSSSSASAVS